MGELVNQVPGDTTGLSLPTHPLSLAASGVVFLTDAFRFSGWLSPDNSVTAVTRFEPVHAGSTGKKVLVTVDYRVPGPPTELFVKFSRDFDDAFRDRRRGELLPEIRFAELSQSVPLPIAVATPAFADFHAQSGSGVLITTAIPFGKGAIEPQHAKCMDQAIADPMAYYRAVISALARLAAAHKAGALDPHVDRLFPYDPIAAAAEDTLPWGADHLRKLIHNFAAFAQNSPNLLPAGVGSPIFLRRFEAEALRLLACETAVKRTLQSNRDMISLSHFNAQIDNAWFWRDEGGALRCGLLDWQRARQMNLSYALWGALSGMSPNRFADELDPMIAFFAETLAVHGGPRLNPIELGHHLVLYAATMGLAGLMDAPRIVLARLPEAVNASGPFDPMFASNEGARGFLHVFLNFLTLWHSRDVQASIDFALRVDAAAVRERL